MGDDWRQPDISGRTYISIHVPRVGDDYFHDAASIAAHFISIHVPRVGDDEIGIAGLVKAAVFLSTSPVWGTTFRLSSIV